jgi:hypothetical protein
MRAHRPASGGGAVQEMRVDSRGIGWIGRPLFGSRLVPASC